MEQPKGPNKDYMIRSLQSQISVSAYRVAEADALIAELTIKVNKLEQDNEELRKSIAENEKSSTEK